MKIILNPLDIELEIIPLNTKLSSIWLEKVLEHNKDFICNLNFPNLKSNFEDLIFHISICNKIIKKHSRYFKSQFRIIDYKDLNQSWLTECHNIWAESNINNFPEIKGVFENQYRFWDKINPLVHSLEFLHHDLKILCSYDEEYMSNNFLLRNGLVNDYVANEKDLQFTRSQIMLEYYDIGRTQYEQYLIGQNPCLETANFKKLIPKFVIYPYQDHIESLPKNEYVHWCNKKNLPVLGRYAGIANFKLSIPELHFTFQKLEKYSKINLKFLK
jgi:hypothetical protein